MRRILSSISLRLEQLSRTAAVGFLSLMLGLVLFQVLARYIFQSVPVWTEEAARYCMIWGGLLGATVAFAGDLDPRLIQPPKTGPKAWILSAAWIRAAAVVVFLGPVLYHSDRFLRRGWHQTSAGMEIPMALVTIAVPLAVIIIFIHLAARLFGSKPDQPKQ